MTKDQQMNDMVEVVEVTQADRDAAAEFMVLIHPMSKEHADAAAEIRQGSHDGSRTVQAFARHRLAHSPGDGMVVVPVVPSEGMIEAGESAASFGIGKPTSDDAIGYVWSAMIAAAGQGNGR